MNTKVCGLQAEIIAKDYLLSRGFKFIESNYSNKIGEIDLIFTDKSTLVFVEVKSRNNDRYGSPFEAVDDYKQNKIRKAAQIYLNCTRIKYNSVRFDVIGITGGKIEYLPDAF